MEVSIPVSSDVAASCTTPETASLMQEIKKLEKVGLDETNFLKNLEEDIFNMMSKKERLTKKLDDNKVKIAKKSKECQIKKRELDEGRIALAAAKQMLRTRKGDMNHAERIELLEEITEVSEHNIMINISI